MSVDESTNQILVFSPVDKEMAKQSDYDATLAALNSALDDWKVEPTWDWRIPTYSEVEVLVSQKENINKAYPGNYSKTMYCFNNDGKLASMVQNSTTVSVAGYDKIAANTVLRPVATVTVTASN